MNPSFRTWKKWIIDLSGEKIHCIIMNTKAKRNRSYFMTTSIQ